MTDVRRNKQLQSSTQPATASVPPAAEKACGAVGKKVEGGELNRQVGAIIRRARKKREWSQIRLAQEVGVTRQSVSAWEKGDSLPSPDNAPTVATKLGIPLSAISADPSRHNVELLQNEAQSGRRVPMLSWVEAGLGAEVVAAYAFDAAHEFYDARFSVSSNAFALRVRGASMEPDFRDGDIIVVDPNVIPVSGEFVVVELLPNGAEAGQGEPVLKQYRPRNSDGGKAVFDLIPSNPEFPTITVNKANPGRIIGTVVESSRNHRLR